ncbi:hypothetical protein UA08_08334 [Talaromyces atroroseus]|uniref:Structure-specific endonuclease subunit SLX4 n=1 Tax=Talaromyces atroroseus TaxID=1441469 RepID=A0A225APN7_TALAT|nr:hypothetical protein UA08_08334 [Talaromyces atroroseus]OKL56385.1 hypothetical protein UA08_08334 [Talaromyces atroroseus]
MSLLETVCLSHVPDNIPVHVALYKDLKNAGFLRTQLISGNADFQYAFIDASVILSRQHVFAAVFRAVNDHINDRLISYNVHSEIVVSLSPTNNIADSFRRFGITDATKNLLVVKVSVNPEVTHESVAKHLESVVEATPVPFTDETLSLMSDLGRIRKIYKISQPAGKLGNGEVVNGTRALEAPIIDTEKVSLSSPLPRRDFPSFAQGPQLPAARIFRHTTSTSILYNKPCHAGYCSPAHKMSIFRPATGIPPNMTSNLEAIVIPSSSPEQNWARSVSPCTPARLFGLPPLSSSPPSLPQPSEVLKSVVTGQSELQSPLTRNIAKANALLSTIDKHNTNEPSTRAVQLGTSKAKTARNRKTAKPQETQNKILKGRVAKAAVSKAKPIADDKNTTNSQQKDVSNTPKADRERTLDLEGLNLDEALRRRLDWTPPKSAPVISLDEDSVSQSSCTNTSFGDILRDYHYNRKSSLPESMPTRKEGKATKRRRLELVEFDIQQAKLPNKQQTEKPKKDSETRKTKAKPRKPPKTITARVTARYEPIDDPLEVLSCDEEPLDGADDTATKKKPTKQKKKRSAKQNEPEHIILSPDAATKSLNDQNFLFGTCSQLERDGPPTSFEETQKALWMSKSLVSEKASRVSSSSRSVATRFTGTKSHWNVAARDFDGAVVQPEIIDMTNSPYTSITFDRITSETAKRDAPKANSPVPSSRILKSNLTVNKDEPLNTISRTDTQHASSNHKSAVVEHDITSSTEQPQTRPPDMPNFNGYTDTELSKQIAAYGFKAIRGRKKMIDLLEKCWQNKHDKAKSAVSLPTANSEVVSAAASTSTVVGEQAREKPSGKSKKTKLSDSEPKASKKKKTYKPATKTNKKSEEKSSSLPEPTSIITIDEIQDSEEEIIPSPTRIRMQREGSSRQTTPVISCLTLGNKGKRSLASSKTSTTSNTDASIPDLFGQITKAIRLQQRPQKSSQQGRLIERLTWHEKILLYDPIILEDLATWLNTEGFALVGEDGEVSAGFVRGWCESQGICCTYRS